MCDLRLELGRGEGGRDGGRGEGVREGGMVGVVREWVRDRGGEGRREGGQQEGSKISNQPASRGQTSVGRWWLHTASLLSVFCEWPVTPCSLDALTDTPPLTHNTLAVQSLQVFVV